MSRESFEALLWSYYEAAYKQGKEDRDHDDKGNTLQNIHYELTNAYDSALRHDGQGEAIATKLVSDPYDEMPGPWFSAADTERLKALPAGTKLYATSQPAVPEGRTELEAVTKAILFADCGNTSDWEENTDLGLAALKEMRMTARDWRDDAIRAAADIAERYGQKYVADDIKALLSAAKGER